MRRGAVMAVVVLLTLGGCEAAEEPPVGSTEGSLDPAPSATSDADPSLTDDPAPVAFTVVGDFGTGTSWELEVAAALKTWALENRAAAFVTTGDNVYPGGEPSRFQEVWHDPYGWVRDRGIELVASLGNHDIKTEGGAPVMELLEMPARFYSTTVGSAHVIVLDANSEHRRQRSFLRTELEGSTEPFTIVVFHHSAYSCGQRGDSPHAQKHWVPLFERFDVELVLNGHNHLYERFERNGITYIVTGGGGTKLYDFVSCPTGTPEPLSRDNETHHFLGVTIDEEMHVEAIAGDGRVFDQVQIEP